MEDLENASTTRANIVVKPPLNTAGPIVTKLLTVFSNLLPRTLECVNYERNNIIRVYLMQQYMHVQCEHCSQHRDQQR